MIFANDLWRGVLFRDHAACRPADGAALALRGGDLDGADRKWEMFRFITYPLLTPIIAVVMTFSVLFTSPTSS